MGRSEKELQVSEIKDLISKSNIIIVWDYLGLKANEISEVRTALKNENAVNKVFKNRIAKLAFEGSDKKEMSEVLTGPSSFLFIEEEESKALKILNNFIKENDNLSFKAGYIDGEFYDSEAVAEIAGLPSREDLLSMLLSVLQGSIRNLAYSLSQVAEQAPADDTPAKEEPAKEEVKEEVTEEAKEETQATPVEEPKEEANNEEEAPVEETEAKEE